MNESRIESILHSGDTEIIKSFTDCLEEERVRLYAISGMACSIMFDRILKSHNKEIAEKSIIIKKLEETIHSVHIELKKIGNDITNINK